MMSAENPKKRKRPFAKDWPPTSAQRNFLIPYGRPLKLLRLDEAPYKELWLKIVSLALVDYKTYKMCCRKVTQFGDVHRELYQSTKNLRDFPLRTLFKIRAKHRGWVRREIVVEAQKFSKAKKRYFEVMWIPSKRTPHLEQLVWMCQKTRAGYTPVTRICENGYSENINRFTHISDWESHVAKFFRDQTDQRSPLARTYADRVGCRIMTDMIQTAPRGLDREIAKQTICKSHQENFCVHFRDNLIY